MELKEYGVNTDKHWDEVMEMAQDYGFITAAYGGTAILVTHRSQLKNYTLTNI